MINLKTPNLELWCPVLSFGKNKSSQYNFPVIFKDFEVAVEVKNELDKLIGSTISEVIESAKLLDSKYSEYHYLKRNRKQVGS